MPSLDTINVTRDNVTTTYLIKDREGRQHIIDTSTAGTPDTEISLLRAGFGTSTSSYANAYEAINAVVPRWKVCE